MKKLFLVLGILLVSSCHYGTMESFNNEVERTLSCTLQDEHIDKTTDHLVRPTEVGYLVTTQEGYIMGGFWGHINSEDDKLDCETFIKTNKSHYWCKPVRQTGRIDCMGNN